MKLAWSRVPTCVYYHNHQALVKRVHVSYKSEVFMVECCPSSQLSWRWYMVFSEHAFFLSHEDKLYVQVCDHYFGIKGCLFYFMLYYFCSIILYQSFHQFCWVLKIKNNWQTANINLSRYRSQSLQVLLDNAQDDTSQDSRTYKLQKEEVEICLIQPIERQARLIKTCICRILSSAQQQFKSIKDQGFRSTSFSI